MNRVYLEERLAKLNADMQEISKNAGILMEQVENCKIQHRILLGSCTEIQLMLDKLALDEAPLEAVIEGEVEGSV